MCSGKKRRRVLKKQVFEALKHFALQKIWDEIHTEGPLRIINCLFTFIQSTDEKVKWRAVTTMGEAVAAMAEKDFESARVILRRLMWNLNDESGGIGWGSPEAMGEILAGNERLAEEFSSILLSYARKDGNHLEHPVLQRGLLWGIGSLSLRFPHLVKARADDLIPYLHSPDAESRALSAWLLGILGTRKGIPVIAGLTIDRTELRLYREGKWRFCRVADVAAEAIKGEDYVRSG